MLDFNSGVLTPDIREVSYPAAQEQTAYARYMKKHLDRVGACLLLPLLIVVAGLLCVINPFLNNGPLIYTQRRMGQHCQPFKAIKFRTMRPSRSIQRGAYDALETDRITRFGRFLRKYRIDELPQIINVLRGEMSLIGPRPDFYDHARIYLDDVPGYRARHAVKPGISGLAQTQIGYVDGLRGVERKVASDLAYINGQSLRLDLWIAWRTLVVVATRQGA